MTKIPNRIIETYTHDGYIIEVEQTDAYHGGCWEIWLYNPEYGVKRHCFGLPKSQQSYDEVKDIIAANIEEQIRQYKEEVEDY